MDSFISSVSVITCILVALVTLLIGWQIFNAISFEKRMKNIAKRESALNYSKSCVEMSKYVNIKLYHEQVSLIYGYIYAQEWFKAVIAHKLLLSIAKSLNQQEYYEQQLHFAKRLGNEAQHFDELTMKEFKEYILELRSLSATNGLDSDVCLEFEKKYF